MFLKLKVTSQHLVLAREKSTPEQPAHKWVDHTGTLIVRADAITAIWRDTFDHPDRDDVSEPPSNYPGRELARRQTFITIQGSAEHFAVDNTPDEIVAGIQAAFRQITQMQAGPLHPSYPKV